MTVFGRRKRRRAAAAAEEARFFARRRFLQEDVTVFGEQLGELHVDTLSDALDEDPRDYYRYALTSYETAKSALDAAECVADLDAVVSALVDGRHQSACVLALVRGEPTPLKLPECFFNPQHGPSTTEVSWAPPGGVERSVAVCASDARRLAAGEAPDVRLVRVGDRYVPLHGATVDGYFPPEIDGVAVGVRVAEVGRRAGSYGTQLGSDAARTSKFSGGGL